MSGKNSNIVRCPKCNKGKIIYDQDFHSGLGEWYDICNIRCNKCGEQYSYDEACEIEAKGNN